MLVVDRMAPGKDLALLIARILMVILFLWSGWAKISGFSATVSEFTAMGVPMPTLATIIAALAEFPAMILILVGFYTRPLSILLAIYVLATAFIGHPYWAVPQAERLMMEINFYKNFSIAGGLVAIYAAGAGRFSLDALRGRNA